MCEPKTNATGPRSVLRAAALAVFIWTSLAAHGAWAETGGSTKLPEDYKARVARMFDKWIEDLWPEAQRQGITRATFEHAFKGVKLNWKLPDIVPPDVGGGGPVTGKKPKRSHKQAPEFGTPGNYFKPRIVNFRVKKGVKKLRRWNSALDAIEKKYGVQREIIIAVWGAETNFGDYKIPHYAVRVIATGAFMGRRKEFFRKELLVALKILQDGHVKPNRMKSSWAGAMGHTQFMPSDFVRYAVDHNGDGRRDIWGTIEDALASTGRYLQSEGWQRGKTWGYEIEVPKTFDCTLAGRHQGRSIAEWLKLGVKRTYGRKFSQDRLSEEGYLLMPAGRFGPAFIALKNFYVIKTYNNADLYALIIGHIADRFGHDRAFKGKWTAKGFRRDVVKDMQNRLVARDLDVGGADGLIGFRTRIAIGRYQKDNNLKPTCWPTEALLKHVRASTPLKAQ